MQFHKEMAEKSLCVHMVTLKQQTENVNINLD